MRDGHASVAGERSADDDLAVRCDREIRDAGNERPGDAPEGEARIQRPVGPAVALEGRGALEVDQAVARRQRHLAEVAGADARGQAGVETRVDAAVAVDAVEVGRVAEDVVARNKEFSVRQGQHVGEIRGAGHHARLPVGDEHAGRILGGDLNRGAGR